MKVIDLFNKMANGDIDEVPNKFVFAQQTFTKKGSYIEDEDGDSIFKSLLTDFSNLDDEIEIIEEPKEELEEIELLRDEVHFLGVNLKVNEIIFKDKINELIANQNKQNKIIRELKDNKENE